MTNHLWNLHSWPEIKSWAFGVGTLTLRPYPIRELTLRGIKSWKITERKPLEYKTWHHPTTSSTLCRTPHLKTNKTEIQTQSSAHRITTSLSLAHQRKKQKQKTKTQHNFHPITKLTQTTRPTLGGQKPKGRKNSTFFKERIQLSLKPVKGDLKYYTNKGTN